MRLLLLLLSHLELEPGVCLVMILQWMQPTWQVKVECGIWGVKVEENALLRSVLNGDRECIPTDKAIYCASQVESLISLWSLLS